MFQRIIFAAALSGLIGGLVVSAIQSVKVVPLIYEAETYEKKEAAPAPAQPGKEGVHENEESKFSRVALTVVSNVVTAVGFALLLIAGFAVRGGIDWKAGILWGIAGFIAFSLAPSIGLPPELPGAFAAPVPSRQIWWVATVAGTSAGLILLAFKRGAAWKAAGVAAIALPHIIGAPHPEKLGGLAPEELEHAFIAASLVSSAIFWIVLGACSAYFFHRFGRTRANAYAENGVTLVP